MRILGRLSTLLTRDLPRGPLNIAILCATALLLSVALPSTFIELLSPVLYTQGEVANFTVRAPRDYLIEDTVGTEKRRAQALTEVKRSFAFVEPSEEDLSGQLESIFAAVREIPQTKKSEIDPAAIRARTAFEKKFNLDLRGEEWNVIIDPALWDPLEKAAVKTVYPVLKKGVLANKRALIEVLENSQTAVLRTSGKVFEREIPSAHAVYDLREAIEVVRASYPTKGFGQGQAFDTLVDKLVRLMLQPNVSFDMSETEQRLKSAAEDTQPVYYRIKRGEVIVRNGDVITPSQERRLLQLRNDVQAVDLFRTWAGYFLLSVLVLLASYSFVTQFVSEFNPLPKDIMLVCTTLVGSFFSIKLFSMLAASQSTAFFYLDPATFVLATPVAAGGTILQVTLGASGVLLFVLGFSILAAVFLENFWVMLLLIILGNFMAAVSVRNCARRSAFIWAGLRVAAVNLVVVLCYLLLHAELGAGERASHVLWAVWGGVLSGILGAGLTPIVEYLGKYVTDIKLLELASLDHPLLRELSLQAPGTWNHSIVLGQMGEAAAEATDAKPLLTRVGAYYHDIGKAKMPAYFVENQTKENRHDKLTPSMSALIIKKHVKDGIEMAEKEGLPQAIIDFIPQHHGTSLIEFFYEKALKEAVSEDEVCENNFRYSGPKPQTKEAAILMLADSVEASSRTLGDPTPAKIQGLVQKMINKVFTSGQLDESNLTLQDLHLIAKAFTRVLTGIYHRRVEYSEPAEKIREPRLVRIVKNGNDEQDETKTAEKAEGNGRKTNGSRNLSEADGKRQNGESSSKKTDAPDSKDALKRLGM